MYVFFHSTLIVLINSFFLHFSSFSKNKQKKQGNADKNPFGEEDSKKEKIEESNPFAEESSVKKNPFASGECLIFLDINLNVYM